MTLLENKHKVDNLRQRYAVLQQGKSVRARDAAKQLGVTELELVAMRTGKDTVRLRADFPALMARIHELGMVMALTRNEAVVHEKDGQYLQVSHQGQVGMALGEEIDLRMFTATGNMAMPLRSQRRRRMVPRYTNAASRSLIATVRPSIKSIYGPGVT